MEDIVFATPAQIESIRSFSDIEHAPSAVYAMGENLAVLKDVKELDPVIFDPGTPTARRLMFIWGLENCLRLNGIPAYYFNVFAENNEDWIQNVETHGAIRISTAPEYRYKKVLAK